MPRYELSLILKAMQRPETVATLRRAIGALIERGAVVRGLESLGERSLPYKVYKHNVRHVRGGYFLLDFHAAPKILPSFLDHLERDVDVVRQTVLKKEIQTAPSTCCGPPPAQTKVITTHPE